MVNSFPVLLYGAWITVLVTLISFTLGLGIGMIAALSKLSKYRLLSFLANQYIDIIRGTPLLIQLFIIYYGLPQIGIVIEPFPSAILGLSLNVGAYIAEVIRSGILSVNLGQREAAFALGLSKFHTLLYITLPQAFKVMIPPLGNQLLLLIKDSSLISIITVVELTRTGQRIISTTYKPIEIYLLVALIYYLISKFATWGLNRLELRMRKSEL